VEEEAMTSADGAIFSLFDSTATTMVVSWAASGTETDAALGGEDGCAIVDVFTTGGEEGILPL